MLKRMFADYNEAVFEATEEAAAITYQQRFFDSGELTVTGVVKMLVGCTLIGAANGFRFRGEYFGRVCDQLANRLAPSTPTTSAPSPYTVPPIPITGPNFLDPFSTPTHTAESEHTSVSEGGEDTYW
jgi:hypothetical protein